MKNSTRKENTEVSRSGRVRKRSSKFNDFESSEESENKKTSPSKQIYKTVKIPMNELQDLSSSSSTSSSTSSTSDSDTDDSCELDIKEEPLEYLDEWSENVNPNELLDIKDEDFEDFSPGVREDTSFSQSRSLYFSEKKKPKEQIMKAKKTERKDKGQSRITAYMLWAKATRPSIIEGNPSMDFPSINRRLGEMWALVPPAQKMSWKKKARQLQTRNQKEKKGKAMISTGKPAVKKPTPVKTNLINKGKLQQYYRTIPVPGPLNSPVTSKLPGHQTPKVIQKTTSIPIVSDVTSSPPLSLKVTGTSPYDVAAHLKLLGESLNNIGQKLKEHEDQIAVSGSLSVLLDSMLCVLGPLACLTNQMEETRGAISEDMLAGILDNIAYIMPGIA